MPFQDDGPTSRKTEVPRVLIALSMAPPKKSAQAIRDSNDNAVSKVLEKLEHGEPTGRGLGYAMLATDLTPEIIEEMQALSKLFVNPTGESAFSPAAVAGLLLRWQHMTTSREQREEAARKMADFRIREDMERDL